MLFWICYFIFIYKRTGWIQYYLLSWVAWLAKFLLLYFLGPMNVGFHTIFGDGSEIPERYQSHLRDILWRNMVFNRWELGDLVMIDNFRISHGRQVTRIIFLIHSSFFLFIHSPFSLIYILSLHPFINIYLSNQLTIIISFIHMRDSPIFSCFSHLEVKEK